ncbi:MAG TPA: HAMP domain-containing protein [Proteobacteria bacterium]|nr:HAMP domain-containing protein [Pseudomonadota bacterium]
MVDQSYAALMALLETRSDLNRIRGSLLGLLVAENVAATSTLKREIEDRLQEIDLAVDQVKTFLHKHALAGELKLVAELEHDLEAYCLDLAQQLKLIGAGKADEARMIGTGAQKARFERMRATLIAVDEGLRKYIATRVGESARLLNHAVITFVIIALAAILFALFIAWVMNRVIAFPLQQITAAAERVAAGDLGVRT